MKRMVGALALVVLAAGCGNLSAVLSIFGFSPNEVTLRLVNETAFRVEPNVYVSVIEGFGFDALTEELLALDINLEDFGELGPGAELTRTYDCDDIGAVMASDAELKTGLGLSPDADTDVFVIEEDFECGDTITIRYTGGMIGFSASISAAPFDLSFLGDLLTSE